MGTKVQIGQMHQPRLMSAMACIAFLNLFLRMGPCSVFSPGDVALGRISTAC
jgi:hypothetical protein